MKRRWLRGGLWLSLLMAALAAHAHESRPAYLEINEVAPGRYTVLWRTPTNAGNRLPVRLEFPLETRNLSPPSVRELSDSRVERRLVELPGGLVGKRVDFVGLQGTITDVLVRIQVAEGSQSSFLVQPSKAWIEVPHKPNLLSVARTYVGLGIGHILGGIDHLLFVLALLLIVRGVRRMVATITAFTVAHSLTLGAATMGWVHVPGPPVEAVIALSIAFVAAELIRGTRGKAGLTTHAPWLVAFGFGLLHGFGFAGALAEVGLPEGAIPTALLCFNVGVEIGQLMFVAIVVAAMLLMKRIPTTFPHWAPLTVPYAIGGMAMFWTVERIAAFWA
jgi:hydrogenase/urease accessory protein HupE